ncbi:tRNA pseudouridine(38-40) synthase TruA [Coprothermobacter platensis]|uniref:tRNA pseudouridine(38-40) synthase TruA n=1 Tax=Coprothermobacter platensis TaxID=108819 RepID=UPI001FE1614E|nr:tRNA pseudouridine(38-40) synthase TruA [Coprothermobacter platensis]
MHLPKRILACHVVKYAALIQFKGTHYSGFQKQKNGLAVQNVLEEVISRVNTFRTVVLSSGRTDAGVHAWGMPIAFWGRDDVTPERLMYILNRNLPMDIRILSLARVDNDFHPQKNAVAKQYVYAITTEKLSPIFSEYFAYMKAIPPERCTLVCDAIRKVVGTHDFVCFSKKGSDVKTTVRTIYDINMMCTPERMYFSFVGDGFLYAMVRLMVGTFLEIGWGKREVKSIDAILSGKEYAKYCVPAQGLSLIRVWLNPDPFATHQN